MGNFDKLRKQLGLGSERVLARGQGCWNCMHWDTEKGKDLWWSKVRQATIEAGITQALKIGEDAPAVLALRKAVPDFDVGFEQAVWGICSKGKLNATFTNTASLCEDGWNGRQGASLASLGKMDKLPGELMEDQIARETHPEGETLPGDKPGSQTS